MTLFSLDMIIFFTGFIRGITSFELDLALKIKLSSITISEVWSMVWSVRHYPKSFYNVFKFRLLIKLKDVSDVESLHSSWLMAILPSKYNKPPKSGLSLLVEFWGWRTSTCLKYGWCTATLKSRWPHSSLLSCSLPIYSQ